MELKVSRQDIDDIKDAVAWPPAFMRDPTVVQMDSHKKAMADVMQDETLSDTDKILKAGYHVHMFNLNKDKYFGNVDLQLPTLAKPPPPGQNIQLPGPLQFTGKQAAATAGPQHSSIKQAIKLVPADRKAYATNMLKKMHSDGVRWDENGDMTSFGTNSGAGVMGANIQDLMRYAQTDGKKGEDQPRGFKEFAEATSHSGTRKFLHPAKIGAYSRGKAATTLKRGKKRFMQLERP
jgi:hypothetical protein